MQRVRGSPPLNILSSFQKFVKNAMIGRIGVSLCLIIWAISISTLIAWKQNKSSTRNRYYSSNISSDNDGGYGGYGGGEEETLNNFLINDDKNYDRYYNLHRVWFGDTSIVMIVFNLWFWVVIFWLMGPILREIGMILKLQTVL
jgi:hypothetical protein